MENTSSFLSSFGLKGPLVGELEGVGDTSQPKVNTSIEGLLSLTSGVFFQFGCRKGEEYQLSYLSSSTKELFGVVHEDILKKPSTILNYVDRDKIFNILKRFYFSPYELKDESFEIDLIDGFGKKRWCRINFRQDIVNEESILWTGFLTDISDLVLEQNNNRDLKSQIEQTQKMESLGTLSGGIAHDFNNILQGVQNSFAMLEESSFFTEEDLKYINYGKKFCERGRDLVDKILLFCRRDEVVYKPVNLPEVLKEIIGMLKMTLPKDINFKECISLERGYLLSDISLLQQVIANIIINSSHALENRKKKEITVELHECFNRRDRFKEGHYLLKITDSGVGMSSEVKKRIFEPFYTTKPEGQGTGMGLAIVHGIIDKHNGDIEIETEVDVGTVFSISLPIYFGESDYPVNINSEKGAVEEQRHVLVVDDEEMILSMSSGILSRQGYRVTSFADPEKALSWIKKDDNHRLDLVITDYSMPNQNGMVFSRKLRSLGINAPIILSSGFKERDEVDDSIVDYYLNKPFSKKEFVQVVNTFIE